MQKILIIQTAFIGDVVLATSVAEALFDNYPQAKIDFLVRKGNQTLFDSHKFINQVIVWNKKQNKYSNLFKTISKVRKEKYDLVVNLQRFFSSGLITILSGANKTVGFDKNPLSLFFTNKVEHQNTGCNKYIHEIDRNIELIKRFVIINKRYLPKLYPSLQNFETVKQYKTKQYICIAPASVWFTKQFPASKWVDFLNELNADLQVYLLGGKEDNCICEKILLSTRNKNVVNLAGKLSYLETTALMADAKMNFVNDSAPMHFASAIDANTAAVFCSTVLNFGFGPLAQKSFVIETENKLECRPCGLHGKNKCPEKHFNCAYTINSKQLMLTLQ